MALLPLGAAPPETMALVFRIERFSSTRRCSSTR
tara:strand:+ start:140 stop:241 length:102 start_codon:yes stop_codon:yes gene_type:complete